MRFPMLPPNERLVAKVLDTQTRIGTVGVLVELQHPTLFRVNSCVPDEWGVRIGITEVPMPGFQPAQTETMEIGTIWDGFTNNAERWQTRYCWKFLFGDAQMQSVIAAGGVAADRGKLLSCNEVLFIFTWYRERAFGVDRFGDKDLPTLLDQVFPP